MKDEEDRGIVSPFSSFGTNSSRCAAGPRPMQSATLHALANNLCREPLECYLAQPVGLISSYPLETQCAT
jgi:hypothetical protein